MLRAGAALSRRFPGVTCSLMAAALLVWWWPQGFFWLGYERQKILAGEWWRLWSGHLVHYTGSHLAANLLVIAVAGTLIERRNRAALPWLLALVPPAISLPLLAWQPQLLHYGGLSGLAMALGGWLCGQGLAQAGRWRILWLCGLGGLVGKIVWELSGGQTLLTAAAPQPFVPVPLAHLVGLFAGLAVAWLVQRPRGT